MLASEKLDDTLFISGNLHVPTDKMAVTMMETIAEFSRKNSKTTVSLVRVVIFQPDMISKYLEEMKRAANSGSSFLGGMTTPFKYVRRKVKGKYSM